MPDVITYSNSCNSGQNVDNGNTKSDRTCIEVTVIQRTTTGYSITTSRNPGSSNGKIFLNKVFVVSTTDQTIYLYL